ncbi:MAG: radical SAM protein [Nitrospirae bacterium]|nr:radical SAM protein [Nitrospirota bacterium]
MGDLNSPDMHRTNGRMPLRGLKHNTYYKYLFRLPKNYLLTKLFDRPLYLNIEVTIMCNAGCSFCDYWKVKKEDRLDDYAEVVNRIKPLYVTISGGEPTLRKDLPDILYNIKSRTEAIFVSMTTHGGLLTFEKARELYESGLDAVNVSLDFPDERHDAQRGMPGLFKHLCEELPKIRTLPFRNVQVGTVLHNRNLEDVDAFLALGRRLGVNNSFTAFSYTKVGKKDFWISPDRIPVLRQKIDLILDYKRRYGCINNSDAYLRTMVDYFEKGQIDGCKAGKTWVQVTADGHLKVCSEFDPVMHYSEYKGPLETPDCADCWFKCRGENQSKFDLNRVRELARMFVFRPRAPRAASVGAASE